MPRHQTFGIKFPFSIASGDRKVLDVNKSKADMVRSELMHLIFTPLGERLRQPTFGSKLIQYIFNPNDNTTWGEVETEIKQMVSNWVPDCSVNEISVYETEDGMGLMVALNYTVTEEDGTQKAYNLVTSI